MHGGGANALAAEGRVQWAVGADWNSAQAEASSPLPSAQAIFSPGELQLLRLWHSPRPSPAIMTRRDGSGRQVDTIS